MDTRINNTCKNLRILFWNMRSFIQRQQEIESRTAQFDIIVCVETWLSEDITVKLPGFISYRKDRTRGRGGGIIVFIRKNLAFIEITNIVTPNETVEMCGILINNIQPPLFLLPCYKMPGHTLTQNQ